jgi:hypothetical protein
MMDEIGVMLNLKKHTVGKKKVPIVGPGDIEGHKALDGRYYLLDYARLMPSQAPIPSYPPTSTTHHSSPPPLTTTRCRLYVAVWAGGLTLPFCLDGAVCREDGKWDGRGVFYQMLRPEFVRSYSTPLSSDVFTGWSMVRPKPFSIIFY